MEYIFSLDHSAYEPLGKPFFTEFNNKRSQDQSIYRGFKYIYLASMYSKYHRDSKLSFSLNLLTFAQCTRSISLFLFHRLQYTSVLVSLLSICSAESCDQERLHTSPPHLSRDNAVEEGRKKERLWRLDKLSHTCTLSRMHTAPPAVSNDCKLFPLHLFVAHN